MKHTRFYLLAIAVILIAACSERNAPTPGGTGGGGSVTPPSTSVVAEADFTYTIEQPVSIVITDKSKGRSVTYDFGDETTERYQPGNTIRHKYAAAGTYKVRVDASGDNNTKDSYTISVTIADPKVYIVGIRYLSIDEDGEYYKAVLKDDDFFTTTWINTNYTPILNNSRLPYVYTFNSPAYMNDLASDDYYTLYIYHSTSGSGSGTQCLKQDIYTKTILRYNENIRVTNNSGNTIVELIMQYQ